MNKIPIGLRYLIVAAVVAIVVLVVQEQRAASRAAGWAALSKAMAAGNTPAALETALQSAKDTPAEPWITLQLGRSLYDAGGRENLERARGLAQQAIEHFPNHAARPELDRVLAAAESLLKILPA